MDMMANLRKKAFLIGYEFFMHRSNSTPVTGKTKTAGRFDF
jgi:hypothetical protein